MNGWSSATERGALMSWRFLSALVPVLCGFLAVLVSNLPLSLTNGLVPAPLLGLVPIYFWGLVRPDLMTPAAVFGIGLFQDINGGRPAGGLDPVFCDYLRGHRTAT